MFLPANSLLICRALQLSILLFTKSSGIRCTTDSFVYKEPQRWFSGLVVYSCYFRHMSPVYFKCQLMVIHFITFSIKRNFSSTHNKMYFKISSFFFIFVINNYNEIYSFCLGCRSQSWSMCGDRISRSISFFL